MPRLTHLGGRQLSDFGRQLRQSYGLLRTEARELPVLPLVPELAGHRKTCECPTVTLMIDYDSSCLIVAMAASKSLLAEHDGYDGSNRLQSN